METLYNEPHPFAVFGTLRQIPEDQGNARLMQGYSKHRKGFLPNFIARGLTLYAVQYQSVPVEVFYYSPKQWEQTIKKLDRLESFDPNATKHGHYLRTLANVRLLPEDYQENVFEEGLSLQERSLNIPHNKWDSFESVPAWIYSTEKSNLISQKYKNNPLIWFEGMA
jgi:gamma-glutamylcyclotransferase (GGCT)/AIG2-like uncharacterized protein YtfP